MGCAPSMPALGTCYADLKGSPWDYDAMEFIFGLAELGAGLLLIQAVLRLIPPTKKRSIVAAGGFVAWLALVSIYPNAAHVYILGSFISFCIFLTLFFYGIASPMASVFYYSYLKRDTYFNPKIGINPIRFVIWREYWPEDWKR